MNTRRLVAFFMAVAFMEVPSGVRAQTPGAQTPGAQQPEVASGLRTCGITKLSDGTTVAEVRVRLRNVNTNMIVAETQSDKMGGFTFAVPEPGLYVAEAVNKDGSV